MWIFTVIMAAKSGKLSYFLMKHGFKKYVGKIKKNGAKTLDDLVDFTFPILTSDIGMTNLEASKFLRKVDELFKREVQIVAPEQTQMNDEVYMIQTRRVRLEIQYMLLTCQTPVKRTVGPFNTNISLYCDLIHRICEQQQQQQQELGEELTLELFTCEGYPLATKPISYISKLSEWCLEEYNDVPLLYAVPRLKCYTNKLTQFVTADILCHGNDTIFIRNVECGFEPRGIHTNCTIATYFQLIKRIQDMTGIPGHLIRLYRGNEMMYSSEDVVLNCLGIVDQVALEVVPQDTFWHGKDKTFSLAECLPTWKDEQSIYGATFFFSCLYSLSEWMTDPIQKRDGTLYKTLGHLRNITGSPPLIHALHLLFTQETLTLPHRVAIQEGLVQIFKLIKPKTPKMNSSTVTIETNQVTEYSNYFWVFFISYAIPGHQATEKYDEFSLACSESHQRMKDPVVIRDSNGIERYVERSELSKSTQSILVKYLYNYKRMLMSFINDKVFVWRCIPFTTCGVDLTVEWKCLKEKLRKYSILSVYAPLSITAPECKKYSMIPTTEGEIGVYIDSSKNVNKPLVYYRVTTGTSVLFDTQDLDREIKQNPPPCFQQLTTLSSVMREGIEAITRTPEEIIMVILDRSRSMTLLYLDKKSKYHSVTEAFEVFCNRTTAYDLKHVIGLTLFAEHSKLHHPISENIRAFNNQFTSFPPQTGTSVYNAISFAIQTITNFIKKHPDYVDVPKRILCLTDGENNHSTVTAEEATQELINNGITMDCVLLCKKLVYTHAIAKATGGYSFRPSNTKELISIFEEEPILSMKSRPEVIPAYRKGDKINLVVQARLPVDKKLEHTLPDKLMLPVQTTHHCLARSVMNKHFASKSTNTELTKRILQELSYYQSHPHPSFEVFPCQASIDFWRIIMTGPDVTPYSNATFQLFIEFTEDYPAKPPNIRFITPIYHCNINSAGRICHTVLDRFYSPGVRVVDIFSHVFALLMDAEPDDPLDSMKATELRCCRDLYLQKAFDHANIHARVKTTIDLRIDLLGSDQEVQVNYPKHLVCPLTLKLFVDPVITPSGETYEREAILEHLKSGKNYDPFSYQKWKGKFTQTKNLAIMASVNDYLKEIEKGGEL